MSLHRSALSRCLLRKDRVTVTVPVSPQRLGSLRYQRMPFSLASYYEQETVFASFRSDALYEGIVDEFEASCHPIEQDGK